jgi:hypothetical protein
MELAQTWLGPGSLSLAFYRRICGCENCDGRRQAQPERLVSPVPSCGIEKWPLLNRTTLRAFDRKARDAAGAISDAKEPE